MKPEDFHLPDQNGLVLPNEKQIREEIIRKILTIINEAVAGFVSKIEGGLPSTAELIAHGHRLMLEGRQPNEWAEFFVWKKHHVLAWRYGTPTDPGPIIFCNLFPDDYPEPLAAFIAELP